MEPSGGSLMPEGLLTGLGDQQIRDLFAYLRSTQPLNDATDVAAAHFHPVSLPLVYALI